MKKAFLIFLAFTSISKSQEKIFEIQKIFENQRFPNIVVAKNGFIVTTWGSENLISRVSKDGGKKLGGSNKNMKELTVGD